MAQPVNTPGLCGIDTLFEAMQEAWALRGSGGADELRCLTLEAQYDPSRITAPVENGKVTELPKP